MLTSWEEYFLKAQTVPYFQVIFPTLIVIFVLGFFVRENWEATGVWKLNIICSIKLWAAQRMEVR